MCELLNHSTRWSPLDIVMAMFILLVVHLLDNGVSYKGGGNKFVEQLIRENAKLLNIMVICISDLLELVNVQYEL